MMGGNDGNQLRGLLVRSDLSNTEREVVKAPKGGPRKRAEQQLVGDEGERRFCGVALMLLRTQPV
jgi:hypothetical protein